MGAAGVVWGWAGASCLLLAEGAEEVGAQQNCAVEVVVVEGLNEVSQLIAKVQGSDGMVFGEEARGAETV